MHVVVAHTTDLSDGKLDQPSCFFWLRPQENMLLYSMVV